MIGWPLFAIPVVLAAKRRYRRIEEFTFAFGVALAATTIISALVPAIGVYQQIGLDPGTLKNINPRSLSRPVARSAADARGRAAPSRTARSRRHRDLSELPCGVRRAVCLGAVAGRWIRPIALLVNGAMLAATPLNGGHYFIDVIAGVAIAVLAIVAARRVGQIIAQRPAEFRCCRGRWCRLSCRRSDTRLQKSALRYQAPARSAPRQADLGLDVREDQDQRAGDAKSGDFAGGKSALERKPQQKSDGDGEHDQSYI